MVSIAEVRRPAQAQKAADHGAANAMVDTQTNTQQETEHGR